MTQTTATTMNNAELSRLVTSRIKRTWKGATCRTGYVGTGTRSNRRQLFVRLPSGYAIDLWFEAEGILLGGVCCTASGVKVFHIPGEQRLDLARRVVFELARVSAVVR